MHEHMLPRAAMQASAAAASVHQSPEGRAWALIWKGYACEQGSAVTNTHAAGLSWSQLSLRLPWACRSMSCQWARACSRRPWQRRSASPSTGPRSSPSAPQVGLHTKYQVCDTIQCTNIPCSSAACHTGHATETAHRTGGAESCWCRGMGLSPGWAPKQQKLPHASAGSAVLQRHGHRIVAEGAPKLDAQHLLAVYSGRQLLPFCAILDISCCASKAGRPQC